MATPAGGQKHCCPQQSLGVSKHVYVPHVTRKQHRVQMSVRGKAHPTPALPIRYVCVCTRVQVLSEECLKQTDPVGCYLQEQAAARSAAAGSLPPSPPPSPPLSVAPNLQQAAGGSSSSGGGGSSSSLPIIISAVVGGESTRSVVL